MTVLDLRTAQQAYVLSAVQKYINMNTTSLTLDISKFKSYLPKTTDHDLNVIYEAVQEHGQDFVGILVFTVLTSVRTHGAANIAVVYTSELHPEESHRRRAFLIDHALTKAHQSIHRSVARTQWDFATEDSSVIDQARRFVSYWCTVDRAGNITPDAGIIARLLDINRDDHDLILSVTKANPAATLQQVDAVLNGEPVSLSSGAL